MENRKLTITSEIINALIDTKGGPIALATIFTLIQERTGAKEEDFGYGAYLILGLLQKFNFLKCIDKPGESAIGTKYKLGPNWDDTVDHGVLSRAK